MRQTKTDLLELDFVHRVIFAVDSAGLVEDGYPDFALAVLAYLVATAEAAEVAPTGEHGLFGALPAQHTARTRRSHHCRGGGGGAAGLARALHPRLAALCPRRPP